MQMRSDWPKVSLGDKVKIQTGHPFESDQYTEDPEDIRLLRGANISQGRLDWGNEKRWPASGLREVEEYLLDPGDVILAMDRPWIEAGLKFARIRGHHTPCLLVQRVARLTAREDFDQTFLKYVIQHQRFSEYVRSVQTGSAVPHISAKQIRNYEFRCPPLPVQRRIADILGALDDKIELNRRMNETLEAMAQALYRHWFVDFGPFQDGEFTDTEELGPIPKGWEVTTVGNTTQINLGQSPKSKYYNEEGDGLVFHQGVSTYGWRFPVHERYCSKKKRVADEGDILISVRAPVGRLNIADRKLIIGRGLTALRREDGNQSFLFYFLKEFFDEENKIGSGTVFNSITKSVLNDLEMVGPPPEVDEEFESIVGPMDEQIRNNHEENQTLAETRDYLLPKMISGEIEVDAAQEIADETAAAQA